MDLSDDELEFLQDVRRLNEEGKRLLWEYAKELEEYTVKDSLPQPYQTGRMSRK